MYVRGMDPERGHRDTGKGPGEVQERYAQIAGGARDLVQHDAERAVTDGV